MNLDRDLIDVTIIGGGLAGMAAAIHLADAGLRVVCIEPVPAKSDPVGESLDWSAPDLLKALGLPMESLLDRRIATYKKHVILKLKDGSEKHYVPGEWLGKPPYNVNMDTLHVDRTELNAALRAIFLSKKITLIPDRVAHVETTGKRVNSVVTTSGQRISSKWFIDASGSSGSLLPRTFQLPAYEYGPHKVAIWDYFDVPESIEGTTLHADGAGPAYMEWVWQIPIHAKLISVGYVTTGDAVKEKRQQGLGVREIFSAQLNRFPDLRKLSNDHDTEPPNTTSFRCRAHARTAGPNWLIIGEAAAMVDPMTSNGVTAALRHAAEASKLIIRYRNRNSIPALPRMLYARRILSLARFFNSAIENVLYDWPVRNRIGPFTAGDVYTIPAWSINVVYSRMRPQGLVKTTLFCALLAVLRLSLSAFHWVCRSLAPRPAVASC
jgi:menaquinone-9 beta-reductase